MKFTFRKTALALGLVAGAAFLTAPAVMSPAMANSLHNEGHFGGSWNRIGPSNSYQHRRHAGRYYRGRGHYAPRGYTAYGYGPRRGYYGAPYYYDRGPGFSITVR